MNYHDALRASWLSQLGALTRAEFFLYLASLRSARGGEFPIVGTISILEFALSYPY